MSHLNDDGLRHDKTIESIMLIFTQFQTSRCLRIEMSSVWKLEYRAAGNTAEVCMDWILDFLDPDSGWVRQDPDSSFLNKNRTRTGFGFCNFLKKNDLRDWAVPVIRLLIMYNLL